MFCARCKTPFSLPEQVNYCQGDGHGPCYGQHDLTVPMLPSEMHEPAPEIPWEPTRRPPGHRDVFVQAAAGEIDHYQVRAPLTVPWPDMVTLDDVRVGPGGELTIDVDTAGGVTIYAPGKWLTVRMSDVVTEEP